MTSCPRVTSSTRTGATRDSFVAPVHSCHGKQTICTDPKYQLTNQSIKSINRSVNSVTSASEVLLTYLLTYLLKINQTIDQLINQSINPWIDKASLKFLTLGLKSKLNAFMSS